MRVRLKGIAKVRAKLASGETVVYHYAWRGGPRLKGEPGTPEFVASYNAAVAARRDHLSGPRDELSFLVDRFKDSQEFARLAPRTQADYRKQLDLIEAEFGEFPIEGLAQRRCRTAFLEWRDGLAKRSLRQADYAWTVLSRLLSWAMDRGYTEHNPCTRGGRLYDTTRAEKTWPAEAQAAFLAQASPPMAFAMLLALWTGQRQGDLLRLTWFAYDGAFLRLKQGKTGVRVVIPVGAPLKAALDLAKSGQPQDGRILRNIAGEEWTADGFRASWGKTAKRAKISGLTFHDLRGTAVTNLFKAGCTVAEVATITGHSIGDVQTILDASYFSRDVDLAVSAIRKLEAAHSILQTADNPLIPGEHLDPRFAKKVQ